MSNSTNETSLPSSGISILNSANDGGDRGTHSSTSNTKAANLSKLFLQDFDFVEESFEEVKRKASQVITEVQEERNEFEKLVLLPEGMQGKASKLQEMRKKVHKLKSIIPFNLITPVEQPNPNVYWRPRPDPQHMTEVSLYDLISRTQEQSRAFSVRPEEEEPNIIVNSLSMFQLCILWPFLKFPPEVILKRSILFGWVKGMVVSEVPLTDTITEINAMIPRRFVEAVYKKSSQKVCGYRMSQKAHDTLRYLRWPLDYIIMLTEGMCLEHNSEREDIDIFYTESSGQAPQSIRCLDVLHMGKWKKSSSQHIEFVDDSELFFKEIQILSGLKYISFRGVSMLQELPKFITKLTRLEFLDLQACYNLEMIPSDISNLKDSLTHLDMSECYFLEHMPKALATLYNLEVLKGFFVGDVIDETTCTLEELFQLQSLVKLSIYTRVKEFPNRSQLRALQKFGKLVSLTISWGGCKSSPRDEYRESESSSTGFEAFSFNLKKLDLQCVPQIAIQRWLLPMNFRNLKRLYIRGGKLHSLGQASSEEVSHWNVEILRLKHMSKLSLSWEELGLLFPALFSLEMVNCPNLGGFPCGDDGVWIKN